MAERVYIIDQDPGAALLVRALDLAGCPARSFPTAEAFLDAAGGAPPGWLLVDIAMAGADRVAGLRSLRRGGVEWPLIAMSGRADPVLAARALHAGAQDVIVKPFAAAELLALIRAIAALRA